MNFKAPHTKENETMTVKEWRELMFKLDWDNYASPGFQMTNHGPQGEIMAIPCGVLVLPNGEDSEVVRSQEHRNYQMCKEKQTTYTAFYLITWDEDVPVHQEEFIFRMPNWALPSPEKWENHKKTLAV